MSNRTLFLSPIVFLFVLGLATAAMTQERHPSPSREDGDRLIQGTVQSGFLWREMNPCEFVGMAEGVALSFQVQEMFSRTVEYDDGVVTFAHLAPVDSLGEEIWIYFNGGVVTETNHQTADVGVEVGQFIFVVISEDDWSTRERAFKVSAEDVFVIEGSELLHSAGGVILTPDIDSFVQTSRSAAVLDRCPGSWASSTEVASRRAEDRDGEPEMIGAGDVLFPASSDDTHEVPESGPDTE